MTIADWYSVTVGALQGLWQGFLNFIPALIGAIVVFVIGWFVSTGVGKLVAGILKKLRFNQIFNKGNWDEALAKADIKADVSAFVGAIIKWVLVIVFLMASVEILGLPGFAGFLDKIIGYLPNVVVAAFIFVAAVIVADLTEKVIRVSVESMKIGYGHIVGVIVRWSIWIFAFLAILLQLRITPTLINTLFMGFVALLVIAGGISFGLGGLDVAGQALRGVHHQIG